MSGSTPRRGSALLPVVMTVLVLATMSSVLLTLNLRVGGEAQSGRRGMQALYLAEAGLHAASAELQRAAQGAVSYPTKIGTAEVPRTLGGGRFWVEVTDNGDGTYTALSRARSGTERAALLAVFSPVGGGAFASAVFAGNSSGDAAYALDLEGVGLDADRVDGDVYSGGDLNLSGDATVTGTIRAAGNISGAPGEAGVDQAMPDLAGMDYENSADYDVASMFATDEVWGASLGGSLAFQLPEDSPAHIFRKNPADRVASTALTVKEDYFLEDPYELLGIDALQDGSDAYPISLTGLDGKPGENGSEKVYFIDGNLWIQNLASFSYKFTHAAGESVRVTFAVKGNVYFADNLFYEDAALDGVAFVALEDPLVADSGNVVFNDPLLGLVSNADAYLFAENDFIDAPVGTVAPSLVNGSVSAGNQVLIDRDLPLLGHSKLEVDFDDRLTSGNLSLPGMPCGISRGAGYETVFWRHAAYGEP